MLVREIAIKGESIRLGQLLKLAGIVSSGAEAKVLLAQGTVQVNAQAESRRGRQLHVGDTVTVPGQSLRIISATGAS